MREEQAAPWRSRSVRLDLSVDAEVLLAGSYASAPDAFWLDGARAVSGSGRWSLMGCPEGPLDLRATWPARTRLAGVTTALLERAADARHADVSWPRLRRAATGWTAFVTSAVSGVRPVASIDGVALDARPDRVEHLQRVYRALPVQQI